MDSLAEATKTPAHRAAALRAFNRFSTPVAGLLGRGLLDTAYTLTEARVLYRAGQADDADVADLRRRLGSTAGI